MEEQYHRYLTEYYHNHAWWSLIIPAVSEEDARDCLNKLPLARILGTVEMEIPAVPGAGLLVRFLCWWRNRRGGQLAMLAKTT